MVRALIVLVAALRCAGCEFLLQRDKQPLPRKDGDEDTMTDFFAEDEPDGVEEPAETDAADDVVDLDDEEIIVTGCGDGEIDDGEICDDGNRVTEFCGGINDCLSDCSLLITNCGNGHPDAGEQCDGGSDCTTSCNMNDYNIGAPCSCLDPGIAWCTEEDKEIIGCEGVEKPPGTGGVLACLISLDIPAIGYKDYYAGGYCSIIAAHCDGELCSSFRLPGDFAAFTECPTGYYMQEYSFEASSLSITISVRRCLKPCDSPSECRWNAYDNFWGECGDYDCLAVPGETDIKVCENINNFRGD